MALREFRQRDERGQAGYIPVLVLVLVVTVAAVFLLTKTLVQARSINAKASNIAQTGRGINASTDAIIQLNTTNDLGNSIEATAAPLVGQLNTVIGLAKSIDAKATTITGSALTINATAKTIGNSGNSINGSARGLEGALSAIDPQIRSIRNGVEIINRTVDTTIGIAQTVRTDVRNILGVAGETISVGACIDQKTGGVRDGDCK